MNKISGHDIIALGFSGRDIGNALSKANEMLSFGSSKDEVLAVLAQEVPASPEVLPLRKAPASFSEAVTPYGEDELNNVESVRRKMNELLLNPVINRGAVMPDCCPAGSEYGTIPVGGAIEVENAIIPGAHSADIACSMYATFFHKKEDIAFLMDQLQKSTRFGAGGRHDANLVHHPVLDENVWGNPFLNGLKSYAERHMADQGDGNHFAYIGLASNCQGLATTLGAAQYPEISNAFSGINDCYVLVTHHGSRGLGAQLYKRGVAAAQKYCAQVCPDAPKSSVWLDYSNPEGVAYWEALQYISRWTRANHEAIHQIFVQNAGLKKITSFGNEHNFVWKRGNKFLHGKGATPAWKDEYNRPLLGLIPLNMAAPILVVFGEDNQEFLSFAPHGAGRNLSRTAVTKPFRDDSGNLQETAVKKAIENATNGLDIRWYCGRPDVSESPLGYKSADSVTAQIKDFALANVISVIAPLGCIMAGDQPKPWERKLSKKEHRTIQHKKDRRREKQSIKNLY